MKIDIKEITGFKNDPDMIYHVRVNTHDQKILHMVDDYLNNCDYDCSFIVSDLDIEIIGDETNVSD